MWQGYDNEGCMPGDREKIWRILDTPEARERYERAKAKWDKKLKPLVDANRAAQHIIGDDLNIHVGGGDDC